MKRHTERDKNMKGFAEHAVVEKRTPLPECPSIRAAKSHRHGGLWCVRQYRWLGILDFQVVSLQAAQRDGRGLLAQRLPEIYSPDTYHGYPGGMTYKKAKELAKTLRQAQDKLHRNSICPFCLRRLWVYRDIDDHISWHKEHGHQLKVSV